MKTISRSLTGFTLLVFTGPLAAQLPSQPSRQGEPIIHNSAFAPNGIVIDHGQAFLLRYGRAALINRSLVPDGQILTWEGRLVPIPSGFSIYTNAATESDGIMVYGGKPFVLHRGRVALLDASVVPSGQVLTREGRLVPLPADFSGFILDRTGNSQPMIVDKGSEAFTKQARVPQVQEVVSLPPRSVPRGSGAAPAPVPNGPNGVVVNLNGATGALLPSPAETGANSNTTDDNVDGTVVNQLVLDQSRFTPASPKGVLAKQARANFTTNVEEVNPVSTTSDRVITPAGNGSNQITAPLPAGSSTARTAGGVPATSGAGTTGRSGRDGAH